MAMASNHKRKGVVVAVSGPSGVGKGTVISKLQEIDPNIIHSVSVTTRAIRCGEQEGVDYYFRTCEEFEAMLERGEILEHDTYCGSYYGTPRAPLLQAIAEGRDVVMDITVPGSLAVLERFPEAVSIFLLPPTFTELRRRLIGRGTEDASLIERRLAKAIDEIGKTRLFEYVVVNEDVERTAQAILDILSAERYRYKRVEGIVNHILEK